MNKGHRKLSTKIRPNKKGYRVITNQNQTDHLHAHLAGGECLGRSIVIRSSDKSVSFEEGNSFYDVTQEPDLKGVKRRHTLITQLESFQSFDKKAPDALIFEAIKFIANIGIGLQLDKGGYRVIANHGIDAHQGAPGCSWSDFFYCWWRTT